MPNAFIPLTPGVNNDITSVVAVEGAIPAQYTISGTVTGTAAIEGNLNGAYTLGGEIESTVAVEPTDGTGVFLDSGTAIGAPTAVAPAFTQPGPGNLIVAPPYVEGRVLFSAMEALDPDAIENTIGRKVSIPLVVALTEVQNVYQVYDYGTGQAVIPVGRPYLVSPDFVPAAGDKLTEYGALPNRVGTNIFVSLSPPTIRPQFRDPFPNEVVMVESTTAAGTQVLKWNGEAWEDYTTWAQRLLYSYGAIEMLDPDGIYDLLGKVASGVEVKLALEADRMAEFIDPLDCPVEHLALLASTFDLELEDHAPEFVWRHSIRCFIELMHEKGRGSAVPLALRMLCLRGDANHVWAVPKQDNLLPAPTDLGDASWQFTHPVLGAPGAPFIVTTDSSDPDYIPEWSDEAVAEIVQFPFTGATVLKDGINLEDGQVYHMRFDARIVTPAASASFLFLLGDNPLESDADLITPITVLSEDYWTTVWANLTYKQVSDGTGLEVPEVFNIIFAGTSGAQIALSGFLLRKGPALGVPDPFALPSKSNDYLVKPFNYDYDEPTVYHPTAMVGVNLKRHDGMALSAIDDGVKSNVARVLKRYALPPHVHIHHFAKILPTDESASVPDSATIVNA